MSKNTSLFKNGVIFLRVHLPLDRLLRLGLFFVVICILFWGKSSLSDEGLDDTNFVVKDKLFDAFSSTNSYIYKNSALLYFLQVETYSRIGLLRSYGNLQSYWTTAKLW